MVSVRAERAGRSGSPHCLRVGTRIRTDILALYASENPARTIARAFEFTPAQVGAALEFETQLARAA